MRRLLVTASQLPGHVRFLRALKDPHQAQMAALRRVITSLEYTNTAERLGLYPGMSYEDFAAKVPVTEYAYWEKDILAQKAGAPAQVCVQTERYQPTSGSTSAQKWIPYSKQFMREMDAALQAWMGDVGLTHGRAFGGCQYWSLSWLPQSQRENRPSNDDLELLPAWKRMVLERVMAVPSAVTFTKTMDESQFATLAYLCERRDLSLVSVWSPTFWLTLLDRLETWREPLAETLRSGSWKLAGWDSRGLRAPRDPAAAELLSSRSGLDLYAALWPRLKLISCWDSAGSADWAGEVRRRHPKALVQGKGLWATEGVITIPFRGRFPAAITSHFLEFLDLDTGKIHPTWDLRAGQNVQPLLSGGHGLLRYKLNDGLVVKENLLATPTFEFRGRLRETDLVGEKMSSGLAESAFDQVESVTGVRPLSLFAVRTKGKSPYYMLLVKNCDVCPVVIGETTERALGQVFHYRLARELGQLGPVRVQMHAQPETLYQRVQVAKGMLSGDIKMEALTEIAEELLL